MAATSTPKTLSIAAAAWLANPATQHVFAALATAGHSARAVGGCVRNSLLTALANDTQEGNAAPAITDIDIATTATPPETIAAAEAAGLKTIATGLQHGTITVIANHQGFEVTTLRRDLSTDGRRAQVAFTNDWAHDAARRDLTINAIYADADGTVFDPLGGLEDLRHKRIRFVGDPIKRIQEDYLRILRFFRFFAQYGTGTPDVAGLKACISERRGLTRLSAERIHQELLKLVAAPGAVATIEIMREHGLLTEVLPVAPNTDRFARLTGRQLGNGHGETDAILRLATLTVHVDEDAERLSKRLRLSNSETRTLHLIADALTTTTAPSPPDTATAKRRLYNLGTANYRQQIQFLSSLGNCPQAPDWQRLLQLPETWSPPQFPLGGTDLIELGAAPGPALGIILADAERLWLDNSFKPNKTELLEWCRQRLPRSSEIQTKKNGRSPQ